MNSPIRLCVLAALLTGLAYADSAGNSGEQTSRAHRTLSLTFEPRGGEDGQFVTRVSGHRLVLGASGAVSGMLRFAGARSKALPRAVGAQAGIANYLFGARPERWRTGVPLYKKIKYRNLYSGIDLIYYGNRNRLEYDLVVAPGASWRSIRLAFDGARNIEIDRQGDLKVQTGSGWVTHGRPVVYQGFQGGRREVYGQYVLKGGREIGFDIGAHDSNRPLIID